MGREEATFSCLDGAERPPTIRLTNIITMPNYDLPKDIANYLVDPQSYTNLKRLHETYAWARANNPVGRAMADGHDPFWVVTKHAGVSMISRDNILFRNGDYSVVCRPKVSIEHVMRGGAENSGSSSRGKAGA
ncbi:hypothetical protein VSR69_44720 [Paraburkholderia phytofirmans]